MPEKRTVKCGIGRSGQRNRKQKSYKHDDGAGQIFLARPVLWKKGIIPCGTAIGNTKIRKRRNSGMKKKIAGIRPNSIVRKIICKGCGRDFYTLIETKKYCYYHLCGNRGYQKDLKQRRLERRQNRVCKGCGKTFTPKRSDAVYCSNACRQRAYRQSVTGKVCGQKGHLPQS